MDDDVLYHEAFQSTLDALELWDRKHPTEDRDPGELVQSEDFHRFLNGYPELPIPKDDPDDFGVGILDHERQPRK